MKVKKLSYVFMSCFVMLLTAFLLIGCKNETSKYQLQFETNGGSSIESITTTKGLITKPDDPVKEDAWFKGWCKDEELIDEFDFAQDEIDKDMTLYAKWLAYDEVFDFVLVGDESEYAINSYKKTADKSFKNVEVPATYNGKNVTQIKRDAFYMANNITNVTLPDTMKVIGSAFYRCENLESINIPEGVTTIEMEAFYSCRKLNNIVIPSTAVNLGKDIFGNCEALTVITVDENNPIYDSRDNCNAIIEKATNKLVLGCKGTLIPSSAITIGERAFYYHQELTSIVIPEGVRTIEREAFNLSGLTTLNLPDSLTTVGIAAFGDCYYLESLHISKNLVNIGNVAFASCRRLKSITVDAENPKYDSRNDCNALIETSTNTLLIGCINTVVPNTIVKIGSSAFSNILSLKTIEIPESVKSIGNRAFFYCQSLTSIVLPEGLTEIGEYAFTNCFALQSAVVPNSVQTIGREAFNCCEKLQSITIPTNLTTLEENVLYACLSLTSLTIPANINKIERNAFSTCRKLESVTFEGDVPEIGTEIFKACESLQKIYVPKGKIEEYKSALPNYASIILEV